MKPCWIGLAAFIAAQMIFKSFDILRAAGFDNVNVDLMFAIPGQTMDSWRQTLAEAVALGSEHLSCYEVIYEEDTPLFEQLRAGTVQEDEDLACAMYDELVLTAAARPDSAIRGGQFCPAYRSRLRRKRRTGLAGTMSTIGGAAHFTVLAQARPDTFAEFAPGTGRIRLCIASSWNAAGGPLNRRRNCRRWRAPGRSPPLDCA